MEVLLLNASLQPLAVISRRRLIILLTKEKVAFLDERTKNLITEELRQRQLGKEVVVVRLLRNVRIPARFLRPNRRNLLLRDNGMCQYCGKHLAEEEATVDHVIPLSRGGASFDWKNLVIACKRCNLKKGNRLPKEVNMFPRRPPRALGGEYAQVLFLRHPHVKPAYDQLLSSAFITA